MCITCNIDSFSLLQVICYLGNICSKTSPQPKLNGEDSSSDNEDLPRESGMQSVSCVDFFFQIAF